MSFISNNVFVYCCAIVIVLLPSARPANVDLRRSRKRVGFVKVPMRSHDSGAVHIHSRTEAHTLPQQKQSHL